MSDLLALQKALQRSARKLSSKDSEELADAGLLYMLERGRIDPRAAKRNLIEVLRAEGSRLGVSREKYAKGMRVAHTAEYVCVTPPNQSTASIDLEIVKKNLLPHYWSVLYRTEILGELLADVGHSMGISESRVWQIRKASLRKAAKILAPKRA